MRNRMLRPGLRLFSRAAPATALLLAALAACFAAAAADIPHHPRLAAGNGVAAGGFQTASGDDAAFTLFALENDGQDVLPLGRYNGVLAGVAVDDASRVLALTRDGALGAYGDDAETLAHADSRWTMIALAWWNGAPLAAVQDSGDIYTARPDADAGWVRDDTPLARAGEVARADFAVADGALHLLWHSRPNDLSGGTVRHLELDGARWRELPPLPLGDLTAFAAFPVGGRIVVAAMAEDFAGRGKGLFRYRVWRDGGWDLVDAALSGRADLEKRLGDALAFSACPAGDSSIAWLTTGLDGALLTLAPDGPAPLPPARILAPPPDLGLGWLQWIRLASLAGFVFLLVVYCRRSRALSRAFPARPPDLLSRGAALAADWLLVSIGMTVYHMVNGDVRILAELLASGDVEEMFWANLIALALFMAVMEGLYGRTPGKHLAGLRVRNALGGPPSFTQAALRNVLRLVDMFPLLAFPGLVGAIVSLLTPGRQRIGDFFAATVVRRHRPLRERKYLLASASPRRLELLQALGLDVVVRPSDIDEDAVKEEKPEATVQSLALAKARAAVTDDGEIVIAADTVVVLDGEILGKPADADDAVRMLSRLSGRSHSVFTGVTVWDTATGQGLTDVEETEVEFRTLSPREIDAYVATGDPMDKAGAYGVQTGHLVRQVRGSLSNVAGLPMEKLQGMLAMLDS